MKLTHKLTFALLLVLLSGAFFVQKAHAASLASVSATLSTSRPSASSPLVNAVLAGDKQAVVVNNGSLFLASDSALLLRDGLLDASDTGLKVASMSGNGAPSGTSRTVYFGSTNTNQYFTSAHHAGATLIVPITATHIVRFTTNTPIPNGGTIIVTYPGAGNTSASPSASGFAFNGLASGSIQCFPTTACSGGVAINAAGNTITLTTAAGLTGNIVVAIGCTGGVNAAGVCTVNAPVLINPVTSTNCIDTSATATTCNADAWRMVIQTTDTPAAGGTVLDSSIIKTGIIQPVQVQGLVEPTLTFTIAGLATSDNFSTLAGSTCGSETSNTGLVTFANFVNLGILNPGGPNKAGQLLTVSTNGSTGYAITATSSGHFINTSTGVWLPDGNAGQAGLTGNDTPLPATIPVNGTAFFGISPCGADVPSGATGIWGATASTMVAGSAEVSNPWNTGGNAFYATIATNTLGTGIASAKTVVRYAAESSQTTPAGIYTTKISYVATAIF